MVFNLIVLYTGRRGSGKTLTMVKDILKFKEAGWTIYSNIEIKGVDTQTLETEDIINFDKKSEMKNCVFVIDEIQVLFDSRRSTSKTNTDFSNFIQQIRKRGIILLATTQFAGTTDLRIRQHTDIIVRPRYNKKYFLVDVIYFDITASEDSFMLDEMPFNRRLVFDARTIFNLYDTNKTIT